MQLPSSILYIFKFILDKLILLINKKRRKFPNSNVIPSSIDQFPTSLSLHFQIDYFTLEYPEQRKESNVNLNLGSEIK